MNEKEKSDYGRNAEELFTCCVNLSCITRNTDLQKDALGRLTAFMQFNEKIKRDAVAGGDEDFANYCLGLDRVATALHAEISMWPALKADRPDDAWTKLVTAETAYAEAIGARENFEPMQDQIERLDEVERVVFPPQVYLSVGTVVRSKICSICSQEYEECDHISGKPYWGELCYTILRDVVPNHVAIVTEPANKMCRVVYFDVEGGRRNRMTWRIEPKPENTAIDPEGGLVATGISATAHPEY
jgi:hypothetical protein